MLTKLYLDDCRKLVSLPELPLFLEKLSACNCTSLDTKITQQQVLQHMLQSRIPYLRKHYLKCYDEEYFFPGDHVIDECRFHTTQNSITIPYLQKHFQVFLPWISQGSQPGLGIPKGQLSSNSQDSVIRKMHCIVKKFLNS